LPATDATPVLARLEPAAGETQMAFDFGTAEQGQWSDVA
jgi:hypothetical protein